MHRLLTRTALAILLLLPSVALAQGANHRVTTRIPNYIGL